MRWGMVCDSTGWRGAAVLDGEIYIMGGGRVRGRLGLGIG